MKTNEPISFPDFEEFIEGTDDNGGVVLPDSRLAFYGTQEGRGNGFSIGFGPKGTDPLHVHVDVKTMPQVYLNLRGVSHKNDPSEIINALSDQQIKDMVHDMETYIKVHGSPEHRKNL